MDTIDLSSKLQSDYLHCTLIYCSHTIDHHYLINPNAIHNALITKAELFNNSLIFKLESQDLNILNKFIDTGVHIQLSH